MADFGTMVTGALGTSATDANGVACGAAVDANGNGNCDPGFDPLSLIHI